jgi:hypothetical protein
MVGIGGRGNIIHGIMPLLFLRSFWITLDLLSDVLSPLESRSDISGSPRHGWQNGRSSPTRMKTPNATWLCPETIGCLSRASCTGTADNGKLLSAAPRAALPPRQRSAPDAYRDRIDPFDRLGSGIVSYNSRGDFFLSNLTAEPIRLGVLRNLGAPAGVPV